MNGTNRNLSIWSLMTAAEENDSNRHKKQMSRFRKISIALAFILLVGTLLTMFFVIQWKMNKAVSDQILKLHAENMALNESVATKIEKLNNAVWEEISNLRFEIELHLDDAYNTNVRQLQGMFAEHSNASTTQLEAIKAKWQNISENMELLHKNISKLLVERLNKLEEGQKCTVLSAQKICPFKISNSNRWDAENCGEDATISRDGLMATKAKAQHDYYTNIRAEQPFSLFNFFDESNDGDRCCARQFYFEVFVNKLDSDYKELLIGLVGADFPVNVSGGHFLYYPVSYGINSFGIFKENGGDTGHYEEDGFNAGDTIGCGLLRLPHGQIKLFYTKNGQLYGKTALLNTSIIKPKPLLYPAVTLQHQGAIVEANFGADLEKKPYKFDIMAHSAQLLEG